MDIKTMAPTNRVATQTTHGKVANAKLVPVKRHALPPRHTTVMVMVMTVSWPQRKQRLYYVERKFRSRTTITAKPTQREK